MLAALTVVLVTACAAVAWVIYQNTYALREERVTITGGVQPLQGVLAWPKHRDGPTGLVVFVHGDGPVDATHDTFYRPIWEAFARAGYASLSWDKPGIHGAPGDWLEQSMHDRAEETIAAIAWAKRQPGIDPGRIGLWGASQAGWVMPEVAVRLPELRFVIAVAPAVNWLRQGRYNLLAELGADADPTVVRAELARRNETLALLEAGAPFERYRDSVADAGEMTPDRWRFILKNYTADASAQLAMLRVPVLLILGGHDRHVDVAETEAEYRRLLPAPQRLEVRHYPDATHAMVRHSIERSSARTFLVAVTAPRSLFATGFLDDQRAYLTRLP
ncbi:alpha/beta hydrolase family protein [Nocardia acididurans]|uniref:alpha/beta hydrolase family protein n=1 Tax=Nocardia acididurans TaxID=2802282 RepID=UPI0035568ECE